jgi:hypothetical protein
MTKGCYPDQRPASQKGLQRHYGCPHGPATHVLIFSQLVAKVDYVKVLGSLSPELA